VGTFPDGRKPSGKDGVEKNRESTETVDWKEVTTRSRRGEDSKKGVTGTTGRGVSDSVSKKQLVLLNRESLGCRWFSGG